MTGSEAATVAMPGAAGAGAAGLAPIEQALDLARWAPSGDNSQPWRFEVSGDDRAVVHAFDTRTHCVYDLEGHASQLSVGAMLETLRIAASAQGRAVEVVRRADAPDEFPVFDVRLGASGSAALDPLHAAIRVRSVQRRPLSRRPLDAAAKARLEAAVGPGYRVVWFEGAGRRRMAWLAVHNAHIRLTIPEAYALHRSIIEWDARYSEDRVPDQALGADPMTVRSMRWAMGSWERIQRMNRWFGGTLAPRLQLDLIPGLRCAAHFALVAAKMPTGIDDRLAAGAAVQRFWLTATALGLQLQPQYTPLVFADYARRGIAFTGDERARQRAADVGRRLDSLLGADVAPKTVFLGRLGEGPAPRARSLRLPLERLRWIPGSEPR
jgi:nitroreductase